MRFAKQKALIGLLFLLMPVMTGLAILETPVVSDFVMALAMRVARFKTGLRVDGKTWRVDAFSFSAAIEEITVGIDDLNLRAPLISVHVSPLSLLLGKVHFNEVRLDSPFLFGSLPPRWFDTDKSKSSNKIEDDFPSWLGAQMNVLMEHVSRHAISFDRLKLQGLRSQAKELQLLNADVELANLDGGQLRLEWSLDGLKMPGRLQQLSRFEGAIALLRERQNQFFVAVRNIHASLGDVGETKGEVFGAQLSGRWPGELDGTLELETDRLLLWLKGSPLLAGKIPAHKISGSVKSRFHAVIRKNVLAGLSGSVNARGLKLDGYFPNDIDAEFHHLDKSTDIKNLKIVLPRGLGDVAGEKGLLSGHVHIEGNDLKGSLIAANAGLCGVLIASDVPDCYVDLHMDGEVPFEGVLEPFEIRARPALTTKIAAVGSEPLTPANLRQNLLILKPFRLGGKVVVHAKDLNLTEMAASWSDGSKLQTDGHIVYNPTFVDLATHSDSVHLETMFRHFLDLQIQGAAKVDAKILYDELVPHEKGRTKVLGNVSAEAWGIEGQTFGTLSGPVEYSRNELRMGPLKVMNGGGRGILNGTLRETPNGSRLRLLGNLDRLEVEAKAPESGNRLFHGFVSGSVNLEGYTDWEKHPDAFLGGPIHLEIDTLTAFDIPYQSAVVNAIYDKRILDIRSFRAKKGTGYVELWGKLHPDKGTELKFKSDEISVKNIGWDPSIDILQDGFMRVDEGFWAPAKGWKVHGILSRLKMAGRRLPPGTLELSGDSNFFRVNAGLGAEMSFQMETDVSERVSKLNKMRGELRNEGFYAVFGWLKKWNSDNPVSAVGNLSFELSPTGGRISTHGLEISGPQGSDALKSVLLKAEGEREFSWHGDKIVKNNFNLSGPTMLLIDGAPGASVALVNGVMPSAFLDLVVPTFRFREGQVAFSGQMPLPPSLDTLEAILRTNDSVLFVPGIGQPITQTEAEVELSDGRLNFKRVHGQLGNGDVSATGAFRLNQAKGGLFIDLALNRAHAILVDDLIVDATGEISIKGERTPYLLTGKVLASNVLYTKEFGGRDAALNPVDVDPALRFALDVDIGSNSRVRNSSANVVIGGKMRLGGTEVKPEIQGNIDIASGSVFAKDTEFRVSQGKVVFPGGGAKVPTINLLATTTIKQPSTDYRIQLQMRGLADIQSLQMDLSSDPALNQTEIVNLLAFGVVHPSGQSTLEAARAEALNIVFGPLIGANLRKTTGVDLRFESGSDLSSDTKAVSRFTGTYKLTDKSTATAGASLDFSNPEQDMKVDYSLRKNVNFTGVWERKSGTNQQENQSLGADLRFKYEFK